MTRRSCSFVDMQGIMRWKLATFHFFCALMVMGARLDVHKYKLAHFIHHVPVFLHRRSIHHSCLSWHFFSKKNRSSWCAKHRYEGDGWKIPLLWYQQIFIDFFTRIFHGEIQCVCILKLIFIFLFDKWRCYVLVVLINIGKAQICR